VAKHRLRLCKSAFKSRSSSLLHRGQSQHDTMTDQSRLLLSIPNVSISQIYEGEQTELSKGTLNVNLLSYNLSSSTDDIYGGDDTSSQLSYAPTSSDPPIYTPTDLSSSREKTEKSPVQTDQDLYLFLSIDHDFEMPLPASTKIFPQGDSAYLIPSPDIPNALIRLDLASTPADDLETFEILLSQFVAYEERPHDRARKDLVLVDSEDGHVLGSIPQTHLTVQEDPALSQPGHEKDPVIVDITPDPTDTQKTTLHVSPAPYSDSTTKSSILDMADMISSGILYSSNTLARGIDASAKWYTNRRPTTDLPVTFQPTTLARVKKIHHLSNNAVTLSTKATGLIASAAHSLGAGVRSRFVTDKPGKKPGLLNKSLIAFETIADSIDVSTKQLLSTGSSATTTVVRHRYGEKLRIFRIRLGVP